MHRSSIAGIFHIVGIQEYGLDLIFSGVRFVVVMIPSTISQYSLSSFLVK
jgi:hypothetical protein